MDGDGQYTAAWAGDAVRGTFPGRAPRRRPAFRRARFPAPARPTLGVVGRPDGEPARPSSRTRRGGGAAPGRGLPPLLPGARPDLLRAAPARALGARVRADRPAGARPADRLGGRRRSLGAGAPRVPEQGGRVGLRRAVRPGLRGAVSTRSATVSEVAVSELRKAPI